jgi:hypothetical protein
MLKSILSLVVVALAANANAAQKEIQISQSMDSGVPFATSGTRAGINLNDDGTDSTTSYGFQGEVYFGMSDALQVGGILGYSDSGASGADALMTIGAAVRYNLSSELREAMFVGGGIVYSSAGDFNRMNLNLQAGKRIALSETITWTPNVTIALPMSGDNGSGVDPEGYTVSLNILSFSGFMD